MGNENHESIIKEIAEQFKPILDNSRDGVYFWLDESNAICNEKLAKMFGCSVKEWCETKPFLDNFVAEDDRDLFSLNYQNSVAPLAYPVTFRFKGVRKDGKVFSAETDMIPLSWKGHAVAYHFVREIKE